MSITSLIFLFTFLPLSLAVYYITPKKVKEYVILAVSIFFYSIGDPKFIILFILLILLTVILGRIIDRLSESKARKVLFIAGILINALSLIFFKSGLGNYLLPLGISFYTFKAISYLADVYNHKIKLDNSPIHDAVYLSFFGQVLSGPLTRYCEMSTPELNIPVISEGVYRFMTGFCKKVLIADVLSKITNEIFSAPMADLSTSYAWLGAICYSLELFFDFAGYTDMAVGISKMFGYGCKENFNYPYMTESVSKFWRRWHISLSEWFRDYIYIPMGGSRCSNKFKVILNLFVVWLLTGLWHGTSWNFVIWGLGYFALITFEHMTGLPGKLKIQPLRVLYRILSLLFINFEWVLFRSENLISGLKYIKHMIIFRSNQISDFRTVFLFRDYMFFIIMAVLFCFPVVPFLEKKTSSNKILHTIFDIASALVIVFGFIWAISFIVAGQNNPFAYANF